MKNGIVIFLLLLFGLVFQVQAVNTNSNQENEKAQPISGGESEKDAGTEEQNKVTNKGEEDQIKTQEENGVSVSDDDFKITEFQSNSISKKQRYDQFSKAIRAMLEIGDKEESVKSEIRNMVQAQSQNQEKIEKNIEQVEDRKGWIRFIVGPNFGEIKEAKKILEQNKEQVKNLNQIKTKLSNEGDQERLTQEIKNLEEFNNKIEEILEKLEEGFSLFGWFNKLIA